MNAHRKIFDQRLRRLMPQLDRRAERLERFRHYVRDDYLLRNCDPKIAGSDEQERLVKAGEAIALWIEQGLDETNWNIIIAGFPVWWSAQVSVARSKAGGKPRTKPKRKTAKKGKARQSTRKINKIRR